MKKCLSIILALVFLSLLLPAAAETLATPELVSAPESVTFYDVITVEVKPVPNAEKYKLHIKDEHNSISDDYEYDTPVIVYDDWPSWSDDITLTLSITAEAEGFEPGEPLVFEIPVKNCDDSIRPEPPVFTLSFNDEVVTNRTKVTITISEGYDAFTVWSGHHGTFPIKDTNKYTEGVTSFSTSEGNGSIFIYGRKNGVWSLASETQTFTYVQAEALSAPEFKVLTDPIYFNEPVEIELVSKDEKTEYWRASIGRKSDRKNGIQGFTLSSASTLNYHEGDDENLVRLTRWRLPKDGIFEPGEYTLTVTVLAEKYNEGYLDLPVTVLAERPDDEKAGSD